MVLQELVGVSEEPRERVDGSSERELLVDSEQVVPELTTRP